MTIDTGRAKPSAAGAAEQASAGTVPPHPVNPEWRTRLTRRIRFTDSLVVGAAVFAVQLGWLGSFGAPVSMREDSHIRGLSYTLVSVVLALAWLWTLGLAESRGDRVVGAGSTEYRKVVDASFRVFGGVAIIAFLLHVDVARGYLLSSLPLGLALLLSSRWMWRRWLVRQRRAGRYSARVVLVGSARSVAQIASELGRAPESGYVVVAACLTSDIREGRVPGTSIPVLGSVDDVDVVMAVSGADTVAVTSTDELPPLKVKQISWALESGQQHLVLAPSIVDIAGPRIHTRPVAGLPLIHVETPRMTYGQRFAKRTTDIVCSAVGLLLISPLLLVLAILVRRSGPGPILFRQTRVGLDGETFQMLKFRSMVDKAQDLLPSLLDVERDSGNVVLFKMRDDPRVTGIGRVMRRFSLDELPQLLNVLAGTMSLVGPRPPLQSEVDTYDDHVHRRFLVKPGMTGLWQVSGRSSLSWDESVRLDLSYVENYSLVGDLLILGRTVRAVAAPGETAH